MDLRDRAKMLFDSDIIPAIDELIKEYNNKDGYKAGPGIMQMIGGGDKESYGLQVTLPNGNLVSISANWLHDTEQIHLSVYGSVRDSFDMMAVTREMFKKEITRLIETY